MKNNCKTPCKECPFLKTSLPSWLGELSNKPEEFLQTMEYNIPPCHMVVDYDEVADRNLIVAGETNPCVGAMQFFANSCKIPRGARIAGPYYDLFDKLSKPNKNVFKWSVDFIKHHSAIKVKTSIPDNIPDLRDLGTLNFPYTPGDPGL